MVYEIPNLLSETERNATKLNSSSAYGRRRFAPVGTTVRVVRECQYGDWYGCIEENVRGYTGKIIEEETAQTSPYVQMIDGPDEGKCFYFPAVMLDEVPSDV